MIEAAKGRIRASAWGGVVLAALMLSSCATKTITIQKPEAPAVLTTSAFTGIFCWNDIPTAGICLTLNPDETYSATGDGTFAGTSVGHWTEKEGQIVLKPDKEAGALVKFLRRFAAEDRRGVKTLTLIPGNTDQNELSDRPILPIFRAR